MSASEDPWDRHANWWRETFTNGADLEYELQILPLAESHLEGAARVLDLGSGEGQLARRLDACGLRARDRRRARTVVGPALECGEPRRRAPLRARCGRATPLPGRLVRRGCLLPGDRAFRRSGRPLGRGGPRARRGRSIRAARQSSDVPGDGEWDSWTTRSWASTTGASVPIWLRRLLRKRLIRACGFRSPTAPFRGT